MENKIIEGGERETVRKGRREVASNVELKRHHLFLFPESPSVFMKCKRHIPIVYKSPMVV